MNIKKLNIFFIIWLNIGKIWPLVASKGPICFDFDNCWLLNKKLNIQIIWLNIAKIWPLVASKGPICFDFDNCWLLNKKLNISNYLIEYCQNLTIGGLKRPDLFRFR